MEYDNLMKKKCNNGNTYTRRNISSSLRIPLLHFYPHKIIIISYL